MTTQLSLDLRAARKLIENESDWYSGRGEKIGGKCALSECWALGIEHYTRSRVCSNTLQKHLPKGSFSVAVYNDTHTHSEVLDLFDRAIQAAEQ